MADDVPDSPDAERDDSRERRTEPTNDGPGATTVVDEPEPRATESADEDAEEPSSESLEPDQSGGDSDPSGNADDRDGKPDPAEDADERESDGEEPPEEIRKYERFKKMDGAQYDRVNEFLRDRTHITAREWAIARLCSDFRTETGVEMTKIGENLPELVPFMTDTYSPQAVNQARSSFKGKIRKTGATFLYGAMCNFFTAEELDEVMYEATEVAKFLLEVEGVDLTVDEELEAEDRISSVMREVRRSSEELRHDHAECPHCGGDLSDD